jgi:hyperosmotically inducible protein
MTRPLALRLALSAALALGAVACKEEGAAEKAGRKMDEAVEKLRHGGEGSVEKAGRKMDEAFEDAGDELDEAFDEAGDEIEELREKTADAIEGD